MKETPLWLQDGIPPGLPLHHEYATISDEKPADFHSVPGLLVMGYLPSLPIKGRAINHKNVNLLGSLYWSRPMVISRCPFAG